MALETGSFIDDLVTSNPTSSDPLHQIDDHFRLIKGALKSSLPGLDRPLLDSSGNVLAANLPAGMAAGPEQASVAEILAGTNDTKYMTPKDLPHHRGVCVAWARVNGSVDPPVFYEQWNFSTVTIDSGNEFRLTLAITMANNDYLIMAVANGGIATILSGVSNTTTAFDVHTWSRFLHEAGMGLDSRARSFNVAIFGDVA